MSDPSPTCKTPKLTSLPKVRTRPRDRDEPDYVREETYIERGKGPGPRGTEMVYRGREESIEDIPRDFPPPGRDRGYDDDDYYDAPRRSKSAGGRGRRSDYDDDRYTDRDVAAAAGAGAGYAAGRRRHRDDRGYDSDYSRSPPRKPERKKSGLEDALGGLGLGGLAAGILGNRDSNRDRSPGGRSTRSRARSRRGYSSSRSRSRGGGGDKNRTERKWAQAAQAALVAGAVEAFRSRNEAGPWTGEKGRRIATAAIGAGGIDGLIDRDPNKKSKRHLAEAVIGGLAANRLANGPRSKSRGRGYDSRDVSPDARSMRSGRSRSRSIIDRLRGRSQSRGGAPSENGGGGGIGTLGKVAGAGAAAVGLKKLYDRARSKSRGRRSPSRDSSADSYVPSRRRPRDQRRSQGSDTGSIRRTDDRDGPGGREVARGSRGVSTIVAGGGGGAKGKGVNDSSDSSSTTDMEKTRKHMRGKELITAGLATVATIHAAHGVYSSMEAHEKRHRLVAEGEMSPEEARKKQTKAWIQDAAAVGIAALGIKGAFSEWKEMNEQRYDFDPASRHE